MSSVPTASWRSTAGLPSKHPARSNRVAAKVGRSPCARASLTAASAAAADSEPAASERTLVGGVAGEPRPQGARLRSERGDRVVGEPEHGGVDGAHARQQPERRQRASTVERTPESFRHGDGIEHGLTVGGGIEAKTMNVHEGDQQLEADAVGFEPFRQRRERARGLDGVVGRQPRPLVLHRTHHEPTGVHPVAGVERTSEVRGDRAELAGVVVRGRQQRQPDRPVQPGRPGRPRGTEQRLTGEVVDERGTARASRPTP